MPDRTEDEARIACANAGYDPDFVGTKGYPNWQDFGGIDHETRQHNASASIEALRTSFLKSDATASLEELPSSIPKD